MNKLNLKRLKGKKLNFNGLNLKKLRKKKLSKKTLLIAGMNMLCLLLFLACLSRYTAYENLLTSQQAAQRWTGQSEERFAQISCFLPIDSTFDESGVQTLRQNLEKKLLEASLKTPETGSLWTDAYAGFSTLSVSGTRGAATATAIGVGGDFFLFHPLTLRNGSYINGDDLMKDRVVLDEELAWKLFGGVELAGLTVTINNQLYQVVGVVSREKDPFSNKAYGDGDACIYVDYSVIAATNEQGITCYEVAMPDPISEFALNTVEAIFPDKRGVILENNTRYRLTNIVKLITDSDERVMQKNGVAYPYWENAARLVENRMTLLLPCLAFLTLFPMGCVSYMIIKQYLKLLRKWQKRRAEKLEYQ